MSDTRCPAVSNTGEYTEIGHGAGTAVCLMMVAICCLVADAQPGGAHQHRGDELLHARLQRDAVVLGEPGRQEGPAEAASCALRLVRQREEGAQTPCVKAWPRCSRARAGQPDMLILCNDEHRLNKSVV